jgi:hypothetical protein
VRQTAVIAVLRAPSTGRPIEPPLAMAGEVSASCRPGRSLPGQNKEPSVQMLFLCSGGFDAVALAHKDPDYWGEARRAYLAKPSA